MRIGIAALHHETNSFSNIPMTWEYLRRTRFEKETYRNIYTPRRNYSGGFIAKGKDGIHFDAPKELCFDDGKK